MRKNPVGTAATLAKIVGTEGWSNHLSNQIDRYIRRQNVKGAMRLKRMEEIEEALSEVTKDLKKRDRLVIGRFISLHKEMAFQAGLRVGMGISIHIAAEKEKEEVDISRSAE